MTGLVEPLSLVPFLPGHRPSAQDLPRSTRNETGPGRVLLKREFALYKAEQRAEFGSKIAETELVRDAANAVRVKKQKTP